MSSERRLTRSAAKAGQNKADAALIAAAKLGDLAATAALDGGGNMNRPTPFVGPQDNEYTHVPIDLRAETPTAEGYTAFMCKDLATPFARIPHRQANPLALAWRGFHEMR